MLWDEAVSVTLDYKGVKQQVGNKMSTVTLTTAFLENGMEPGCMVLIASDPLQPSEKSN